MFNFRGAFRHFAQGGSYAEAREKGFTLIELMVVIAIGGLILAGVVMQFSDAGDQNKSQTSVKNLAQLSSAIESLRDVRQGWAGVTETVIAKSSAAPSNMMSGGILKNIFGGAVTVTGSVSSYTITYPNVPQKNCIDIAAKALTMFNGGIKAGATGGTAITTVAGAATACTATNTMKFVGS